MTGRAVASATRGRRAGGAVTLESGVRAEIEQGDELPEIVVMASGCLGLVSFPREPGRVTLERLTDRYPGLLAALLEHPGIGFVLVCSEGHGASSSAHGGSTTSTRTASRATTRSRRSAPTPRPTCAAPTGSRIVLLLVNAAFSADTEDVAAFEELVGSHGGMGEASHSRSSCSRARCPTPRTRWSVPSGCIA